MAKISTKEFLVRELQEDGHDAITACDIVVEFLREMRSKAPGTYTLTAGTTTIKLRKEN